MTNEDIIMLQTIERYLDGSMLPAERSYFEQLRKNTSEIDQMVVEHSMFLAEMNGYKQRRNFKHTLNEIHDKLLLNGDIKVNGVTTVKGKVIQLYHKYKRDMAIAASVGGVIAVVISTLFSYFSPSMSDSRLQQLSSDLDKVKKNQQVQGSLINEVKGKIPKNVSLISGGSGFLIDCKGFIVTNAHVVKGNSAIVANNNGDEFNADIVFTDASKDIAILKINDEDFKNRKSLPYTISKNNVDLGEEIFTLGFPKTDITYTQGYLSSNTGLNGDTTNYQIQMNANPGNSGGPVFNRSGELVGILSSKQTQADGVTFAIKSKNLFSLITELRKEDTLLQKIKMPISTAPIKIIERKEQVKKIEDCVFSVKAYNKI
jgi:S1-C subfamily serine protease